MTSRRSSGPGVVAVAVLTCSVLAGCRQDMHDAPRVEPLERSDFFTDQRGSRPLVEGTVARGHLRAEDVLYTGMLGTTPVDRIPLALTRELVERGRNRFEIYCTPCHGRSGEGNGLIVQRGYKQPTSFHDPRLRNERAGYFFDVMTRGFGQMPDYAAQVAPQDRWAIVSYIRALQLSRNATIADVPDADRKALESGQTPPPAEGAPKHD
jgi:mono/diheme cytochrome c family protein